MTNEVIVDTKSLKTDSCIDSESVSKKEKERPLGMPIPDSHLENAEKLNEVYIKTLSRGLA